MASVSMKRRRALASAQMVPLPTDRPRRDAAPGVRTYPSLLPGGRRLHLRWRRYVVLGVAMYCAWVGRGDVAVYLHQRAELRVLAVQAQALRRTQARLRARVAYAETDGYVAAKARQEFGLVSPGQVPLAPLSPGASPRPASGG